ncbi:MAG: TetR/AcrR family transcriptional regulator [Bacilli bacterium]
MTVIQANASLRTKKIIMLSFLNLLTKNSINKISVNEIIKTAGVSKATFYKYYTDKYSLLAECFNRYCHHFEETLLENKSPDFVSIFTDFLNEERGTYNALSKAKYESSEFSEKLKNELKKYFLIHEEKETDISSDLKASTIIWSVNYLYSQNIILCNKDILNVLNSNPILK